MPFYVRLGPRGLIFRVGTVLIRIIGSVVYLKASRERARTPHLRPVQTAVARRSA